MTNQEDRKTDVWKELVAIYGNAIASVDSVMKKNKDLHFFETLDGWDDTPDPITSYQNTELTAEELFNWMYEEGITIGSEGKPYVYTDDEIEMYRKNRELSKIPDWKKSIEFCKSQIRKYEQRIAEAKANANRV